MRVGKGIQVTHCDISYTDKKMKSGRKRREGEGGGKDTGRKEREREYEVLTDTNCIFCKPNLSINHGNSWLNVQIPRNLLIKREHIFEFSTLELQFSDFQTIVFLEISA